MVPEVEEAVWAMGTRERVGDEKRASAEANALKWQIESSLQSGAKSSAKYG